MCVESVPRLKYICLLVAIHEGLAFEREGRRGFLAMSNHAVEVSSKACTPRARREASAKAYRSAYPLGRLLVSIPEPVRWAGSPT